MLQSHTPHHVMLDEVERLIQAAEAEQSLLQARSLIAHAQQLLDEVKRHHRDDCPRCQASTIGAD